MDAEAIDRDEAEQPRPHWARYLFSWPALILLGWAVYELTAQPALGVAMICFKFGWEDYATAFWLRKRDKKKPGRASASFWLYLASGLWSTAVCATIMVFAFALLAGIVQGPKPQPAQGLPPHVLGAILTAFFGFGLATVLTAYALFLGLIYREKLWLSSAVHMARRTDNWPPSDYPGRGNKLIWLVLTTTVFTVVPLTVALVGLFIGLFVAFGPGQRLNALFPLFVIAALVGGAVLALIVRDFVARRVIATAPSDCWPPWEETPDEALAGTEHVTEL